MIEVIHGITSCLGSLYPDHPIYTEQVKQGFAEPCFFVRSISSGQARGLDRRYTRMMLITVRYFPDPSSLDMKGACERIAERLYAELEYIQWEGETYRANSLRHEVVDDVLHFLLELNVRMLKLKPAVPKMNQLKKEVTIRDYT
ncbi:DUF6838 family protein [Paenibacillus sp. YYML68]|uniref:phage tail terminator family protein n=1 Tax=Paenibacillus sp. YYML68 TaxID=2909250 RepID=UPI0024927D22|nr:hypothetical protein [Paenibacillus sp. YYML68]